MIFKNAKKKKIIITPTLQAFKGQWLKIESKLRGKKVNAVVLLRAFSTVIHKIHMVGRTNNIETNNKFTCWTIKQEIFKILRELTSNAVKRMHELLIINNDIKVPSINSIEIKCQNNQND